MRVIGLMSGTSYDAIDAAAADLLQDGDTVVLRPLGQISRPLPEDVRAELEAALPPQPTTMAQVCRLDTRIGQAFAEVAKAAVHELCEGQADLVASHGQTLFHWVDDGVAHGTLQLGQPAWIAERTGLPVVADLRSRDVAAGGQGAPLVSVFDTLVLHGTGGAALNLGGIANVTVVTAAGDPTAFDTGPANALLDAAVRHYSRGAESFDRGGAMAGAGSVHGPLLRWLLAEPYYTRAVPKTTGKELFHLPYLAAALDSVEGRDGPVAPVDVLATLTELTARTVADAIRPWAPAEVIASGGGVHNPVLMARLAHHVGPARLRPFDELGLPASAKEAYAFALLGWLTACGLPGTVASCTGARHPSLLGCLIPGAAPLQLPAPPPCAPTRLHIDRS